jgi:hypothetical protein
MNGLEGSSGDQGRAFSRSASLAEPWCGKAAGGRVAQLNVKAATPKPSVIDHWEIEHRSAMAGSLSLMMPHRKL